MQVVCGLKLSNSRAGPDLQHGVDSSLSETGGEFHVIRLSSSKQARNDWLSSDKGKFLKRTLHSTTKLKNPCTPKIMESHKVYCRSCLDAW